MIAHLGSHHGIRIWGIILSAKVQTPGQTKTFALLDKVLDLLQPAEVLLLLLDIDVLGNEDGEVGVNTTLVEVVFKESLEVLVELGEGRTGVHLLG